MGVVLLLPQRTRRLPARGSQNLRAGGPWERDEDWYPAEPGSQEVGLWPVGVGS